MQRYGEAGGGDPCSAFRKYQRSARRKLDILAAATSLEDLKIPPSNHLEKLVGDRARQYSIRVNIQSRICFEWSGKAPHQVEIVDYL